MTRLVAVPLVAALLLTAAPRALAQGSPASNASDAERPDTAQRFRNFTFDAAGSVVLVETIAWAAAVQATEMPVEWGGVTTGFGREFIMRR